MIYNKINEFCAVRNLGTCRENGTEPTPRVKFIMELLDSEGIEYELDVFESSPVRKFKLFEPLQKNKYFNIIMKGTSNKMIIAHHDIVNPNNDNANDNSCSVINVIATKKLKPDVNAVIVDGEEMCGIGSSRLGQQIIDGKFGEIEWVLNFELTGKGGKYFFIGDYPGPLRDKIQKMFDCPVVHTPFNDSITIRKYGIDSTVINPLPPLPEGETSEVLFNDGKYLDFKLLFNCHSTKDNLSTISPVDMKEFVEEVILKILA